MHIEIDKDTVCLGNPPARRGAPIHGVEPSIPFDGSNRKIEIVAVSRLRPYQANPRTHSPKQIRQIAESITRFGFCNPILIDDNNQIIAGHGRVEAVRHLGLETVPALRLSHLSDIERRAYVIADNRLAEVAGWDRDMLATELESLIDLKFDVELTGFDIGEVELMLRDADEVQAEILGPKEEIRERIVCPAVSQAGDQWLLGVHRLLCGDVDDQNAFASIDAAIRRWQRCTGQPAMLANTGKSFQEIENERAGTVSANAARIPAAAAKRRLA